MEEFKFNIKITPIIKNRDWTYQKIKSSRKLKTCVYCEATMAVGTSSVTFTKRITTGGKNDYEVKHTHLGLCATRTARQLGFKEDEIDKIEKL